MLRDGVCDTWRSTKVDKVLQEPKRQDNRSANPQNFDTALVSSLMLAQPQDHALRLESKNCLHLSWV